MPSQGLTSSKSAATAAAASASARHTQSTSTHTTSMTSTSSLMSVAPVATNTSKPTKKSKALPLSSALAATNTTTATTAASSLAAAQVDRKHSSKSNTGTGTIEKKPSTTSVSVVTEKKSLQNIPASSQTVEKKVQKKPSIYASHEKKNPVPALAIPSTNSTANSTNTNSTPSSASTSASASTSTSTSNSVNGTHEKKPNLNNTQEKKSSSALISTSNGTPEKKTNSNVVTEKKSFNGSTTTLSTPAKKSPGILTEKKPQSSESEDASRVAAKRSVLSVPTITMEKDAQKILTADSKNLATVSAASRVRAAASTKKDQLEKEREKERSQKPPPSKSKFVVVVADREHSPSRREPALVSPIPQRNMGHIPLLLHPQNEPNRNSTSPKFTGALNARLETPPPISHSQNGSPVRSSPVRGSPTSTTSTSSSGNMLALPKAQSNQQRPLSVDSLRPARNSQLVNITNVVGLTDRPKSTGSKKVASPPSGAVAAGGMNQHRKSNSMHITSPHKPIRTTLRDNHHSHTHSHSLMLKKSPIMGRNELSSLAPSGSSVSAINVTPISQSQSQSIAIPPTSTRKSMDSVTKPSSVPLTAAMLAREKADMYRPHITPHKGFFGRVRDKLKISQDASNNGIHNQPQSTTEDEKQQQPQMMITMRKQRKKSFNEDKPWKHHIDATVPTENEKKRYEGLWATNRGIHIPYMYMEEDEEEDELSDTESSDSDEDDDPEDEDSPLDLEPEKEQRNSTDLVDLKLVSDDDPTQLIHGYVVRALWQRSRLSNHVLETIWNLVDRRFDGCLDREGFVVGTWLVDQCLYGRKLPLKIDDRIWKSVGRLNVRVKIKKNKKERKAEKKNLRKQKREEKKMKKKKKHHKQTDTSV